MFKTFNLGDVCSIESGSRGKGGASTLGIPSIGGEQISSAGYILTEKMKYITEEHFKKMKQGILKPGDILLVKDGATTGKCAFYRNEYKEAAVNEHVFILRANNIILPRLLYYVISSDKFQSKIKSSIKGIIGGINLSIKNLEIYIPDTLAEQQEIVQVLDTMSDIIRLREECISHAQDLIPALFQEMFGNPLKNKTPFKIGQFYNVGTGATPRRENESYYIGNNPWVKTTEVNNCYIEQTEEHISDEAISKTNCTLYEPNTIIMAMYGQGKTRGKVAYLKVSATTNQACAALQLKENYKDEINNIFVFYYLQFIYNYLRTLSQGGGRPNMNLSIVRNIPLYKPDIKLQNIFANKVLEIENYIKEQRYELENAKQMFQSLLHHAFTGELTRRIYEN